MACAPMLPTSTQADQARGFPRVLGMRGSHLAARMLEVVNFQQPAKLSRQSTRLLTLRSWAGAPRGREGTRNKWQDGAIMSVDRLLSSPA